MPPLDSDGLSQLGYECFGVTNIVPSEAALMQNKSRPTAPSEEHEVLETTLESIVHH